ncbi:MAG: hypothetical protein LBU90_03530 [Bacteroidales bacterium]|jgi:hypothetical protein|nr:hypothetical protein [Bacteroidales bacterium]
MPLSWNEIKERAIQFSREWAGTAQEEADAKPFLDAFFDVFGISRRKVGTFEHRVKKLSDADGYIDLLWKGTILVEMKSRGRNLDRAFEQAIEYTHGLKPHELPRFILVCDFEIFRLYDLEARDFNPLSEETARGHAPLLECTEFRLADLVHHVQHFGYMIGYEKKVYKEENPANAKAAELMGKLHDRLKEIGYDGHPLEVYLVRVLFILFAEDTTIFEKQQFQDFIERRTAEDGSDLADKLHTLFQVLNTPSEKRLRNLDEEMNAFPYVNGKLFEELLPTASFDSKMRQALLNCCYFDWSEISPAIFGSMFQSVMNPKERHALGAHYTSEKNILKLIKPLFLDELYREFEQIKQARGHASLLQTFHKKLGSLRFLDPACGCGNFLVIAYRELRLLEIEVLRALYRTGERFLDVSQMLWIDVDQFYGIEYEEFPARIAEVALWLTDHQMNMKVSAEFGQYFVRLPLKKAAKIVHGDALEIDWNSLATTSIRAYDIRAEHTDIYVREPQMQYGNVRIETDTYTIHKTESTPSVGYVSQPFDYIMGNPPFIGSKVMTQFQRDQVAKQFGNASGCGVLDYVTAWYVKAAQYITRGHAPLTTKVAFVSTNSIVQGEQTAILWGVLKNRYHIKIHFAHRTFKWSNEAKGNAAVYCVIVGFANFDTPEKRLFDYEDIRGEAHEISAKNINPYLVDAKDIFIEKRQKPLCKVPEMNFGNMPLDGGNLLFTDAEKQDFLELEPNAAQFMLPLISAHEFLNGEKRWCLWLKDATPAELNRLPRVLKRIAAVKKFRLDSVAPSTQKFAATPALFRDRNRPDTCIVIPRVSSETRDYIPMGFFDKNSIVSDTCMAIPNATLYHFGVLMSKMHMAWVGVVCGRLESRYRYSKDIVYNNFPWAENPTEKQVKAVEKAAQKVLDVRAQFPESSLAHLYNPLTMPPELTKAHRELDKAVDAAYSFVGSGNRMEFLFALYEKYTADLFTEEKENKVRKKKK